MQVERNPLCSQIVLVHLPEHFSYLNTLWSQHVWVGDFLLYMYISGEGVNLKFHIHVHVPVMKGLTTINLTPSTICIKMNSVDKGLILQSKLGSQSH